MPFLFLSLLLTPSLVLVLVLSPVPVLSPYLFHAVPAPRAHVHDLVVLSQLGRRPRLPLLCAPHLFAAVPGLHVVQPSLWPQLLQPLLVEQFQLFGPVLCQNLLPLRRRHHLIVPKKTVSNKNVLIS